MSDATTESATNASEGLDRITSELSDVFGLSDATATLLALVAVAAAIGRSCSVIHPLTGGTLPLPLNLLVVADLNSPVRYAAGYALQPFLDSIQARLDSARTRGSKQLRAERLRLEARGEILREQLRNETTAQPTSISSANPGNEEKLKPILEESQVVAWRLLEIEVEMKPFLLVESLSSPDIRAVEDATFDGALACISFKGSVVRDILSVPRTARREMLRLIHACWLGEFSSVRAGVLTNSIISNLWVLTNAEFGRLTRCAEVSEEGLLQTFLKLSLPASDVKNPTRSIPPQWVELLQEFWAGRMARSKRVLKLADEAGDPFCALLKTTQEVELLKALPETILKIASLLHIARRAPGDLIAAETVQSAIEIVEKASVAISSVETASSPSPTKEGQLLEQMLKKLRLHGPQTRRNLFRRFKIQRAGCLDPVLELAVQRGDIAVADGVIQLT